MSLFLLFGSVTAVLAAFAAVVASAREFGFDAFRPTVTRKLRQCKVKVKFLVGIEGKICVFFSRGMATEAMASATSSSLAMNNKNNNNKNNHNINFLRILKFAELQKISK